MMMDRWDEGILDMFASGVDVAIRDFISYLAISRGLFESGHDAKGLFGLFGSPVFRNIAGKVGAGDSEDGANEVAKTVKIKVLDLKGGVLARGDLVEGGGLGGVEECVNHVCCLFADLLFVCLLC